jgi:hypothetical protein
MKKTSPAFKDLIHPYSAQYIATVIGCPKSTAYDWLNGRRSPPVWQQGEIVARLAGGNAE